MFKLRITGDLGFEVWRDIPGYEGLYQASTYGRIKNKKSKKVLQGYKEKQGYITVNLDKPRRVHRMVAITFLPNPNNFPQVNHIDEDKTNNNVVNLEWCTAKYNLSYGTAHERSVATKIIECKLGKPIIGISKEGKIEKKYRSVREASRDIKKNSSSIFNCLSGKKKTCGGYFWKYA